MNIRSSSGIQIAGLANIVGSNSFVNLTRLEEKELKESGVTAELKGFQFSGILNFVREDVTGAQFTGGFNLNQNDVYGAQFAGISNLSGGHVAGVQISGIMNLAKKSIAGIQIASMINYTRGSLSGVQIASVNRASIIQGKHSKITTGETVIQIGIINKALKMNGFQVGLINIGKKMKGTQVGLINFFKTGPYRDGVNSKYGTPIGLINIGSSGNHLRIYATDLFLTNVEYTTGNCYNCSFSESKMPIYGRFKVLNQNALIYGRNIDGRFNDQIKWGIGYGFQKVLLNKASLIAGDPRNQKVQLSYGLRFVHLNKTKKLMKDLSLLSRIHSEVGGRFIGIYWFAGLSINAYMHKGEALSIPLELSRGRGKINHQLWTGYSFGVQL